MSHRKRDNQSNIHSQMIHSEKVENTLSTRGKHCPARTTHTTGGAHRIAREGQGQRTHTRANTQGATHVDAKRTNAEDQDKRIWRERERERERERKRERIESTFTIYFSKYNNITLDAQVNTWYLQQLSHLVNGRHGGYTHLFIV